jgi:L-fuconolactonase
VTRIDAHQHFWQVARGDYAWMTPDLVPLYRDFGPEDLGPLLAAGRIDGTVLVQAAQTEAETRFLLDVARRSGGMVRGVVGWVDFAAPDAPDRLAALARDPMLKGVRPMLQDIPDPDWILQPDFAPVFQAIVALGLRFDALVKPRQLPRIVRLVERHPDLPIVLDHGAKPEIEAGRREPWASDIAALAAAPHVRCKLSGLVTEDGPDWSVERLRPYVDDLIGSFGPGRLMWGSDWPVATLRAGYGDWLAAAERLTAGLTPAERDAVFGGNAIAFYGLDA